MQILGLQSCTRKWIFCARLRASAMCASICLIALLTGSCRGIREIDRRSSATTDSVVIRERTGIIPVAVPASKADIRLNLMDISSLTKGAVFTRKEGQATVSLSRQGDTVYVSAICDSLQVLVESNNREIYRLRTQLEQQHTVIEKPPSWWESVKNNVFYVAVGMAIMLVISLITRIWRKIRKPG